MARPGEDITDNVRTIRTLPLTRSGDGTGQLGDSGRDHLAVRRLRGAQRARGGKGRKPFVNPRNTAAGSLKLHNSAEVARRGLDCFLYGVELEDGIAHQPFGGRRGGAGMGLQNACSFSTAPSTWWTMWPG